MAGFVQSESREGWCNWVRAGCTDDTPGLLGPSLLTFLACSEWFRALWIGERVMTAPTSLSSQPRLGKLPAHKGGGQAARQRVEVMEQKARPPRLYGRKGELTGLEISEREGRCRIDVRLWQEKKNWISMAASSSPINVFATKVTLR